MMQEEKDEPPSYHSAIGMSGTGEQPTAPILGTGNWPSPPGMISASFPPLTEGAIKRACHFYVTENCCYGSSFVDEMTMSETIHRIAYHYTLESYGEKRETAEHAFPYRGGNVDGRDCGPAPAPWDVPVIPPRSFRREEKRLGIPHTSYTKPCNECNGKGNTRCIWCFGVGGKGCMLCSFDKNNRPCTSCQFSNRRCSFCSGTGRDKCDTCDGQGKLISEKILIVRWENHMEHFVTDTMELPSEVILEAEGKKVFVDEANELSPILNVVNSSVTAASRDMLNKHRSCLQNEAIVRQRHTLRAVPFTQVKYRWEGEIGEFYVYGMHPRAYFQNYPQQCCCAIM